MSQRVSEPTRRLRWAAPLAAVLVLGTGTAAANAVWQDRKALASGVTSTGTLSVTAAWSGGSTSWQPLRPGRSADSATLRVTATGAGDTLRWRISATPTVSAAVAPYVTAQTYVGACGTGILLPAGGYAPTGGYALGQSVDLCLRLTLSADAPSTTQGVDLSPRITVAADQLTS